MLPLAFVYGTLIIAVLLFYLSVPGLLWGLQQEARLEFDALGSPTESELFSRQLNLAQWHFMCFVLRGEAYAVTRGSTRRLAVLAWLSYISFALCILGLFIIDSRR